MSFIRLATGCLLVLTLSGCGDSLETKEPHPLDFDDPVISAARAAKTTELDAELDAFATRAPGVPDRSGQVRPV